MAITLLSHIARDRNVATVNFDLFSLQPMWAGTIATGKTSERQQGTSLNVVEIYDVA